MLGDEPDEGVRAAIAGEMRLLEASVRRSPEQVNKLLHPAFLEFGASGRRWNRPEIIEALAAEEATGDDAVVANVADMSGIRLADDVVLVTYISQHDARRCRRSSIWRRTDAGWSLFFHQGTIITGD